MTAPVHTLRDQIEHEIEKLQRALTQLEPDGRICAVCHDNDHQAFECSHNPHVQARRWRVIRASASRLHDELHKVGL